MSTRLASSVAALAARAPGAAAVVRRAGAPVLALAAYAAAHALWLGGQWGGPARRVAIADAFLLPLFLVTALAAWRAARQPGLAPGARRAWRWLTASYALLWLANVAWTWRDVGGGDWLGAWGKALVLASYAPLLAGLFSFPRVPASRGEHVRAAVDVTTVLLGVGMTLWFVATPSAAQLPGGVWATVLAFGTPAADLVVVAAVSLVALGRRRGGSRLALGLLAAGHALSVAAGLVTAWVAGTPGAGPGHWVDAIWMASAVVLFAAADAEYRRAGRAGAPATSEEPDEDAVAAPRPTPAARLGAVVPYLGVALGYGLLLAVSRPWWGEPAGVVVFGTAALTALVVARQVLALRDNRRLAVAREAQDAYFRRLIEHASDAVYVVDAAGAIQFASAAAARAFAPERGDAGSVFALVHPDDAARARAELAAVARDRRAGTRHLVDLRVRHRDGSWRAAEAAVGALPGAAGHLVLNVRDVTERVEAERALRESQRALATMVSNLPGMAYRCRNDRDWTMEFVSDACAELTGYPAADLYPAAGAARVHYAELIHPDDREHVWIEVQAAVEAQRPYQLRYRITTARGEERHVWEQGRGVADERGRVRALEGIVLDVTERARAEAQLAQQAFHDPLTGLVNRTLFRDRVGHALAQTGRSGGQVAVLFLDLDNFKGVNDSLGHAEGDRLLLEVAARLLNATRGCDTVARLGGDEFAVLLDNAPDEGHALVVANRILTALTRPVVFGSRELLVGASIGIASGGPAESADELLRNADLAMYRAKARGKGTHEVFAPEMYEALRDRMALEADLRHALERGEFRLAYQPILNLHTEQVVGVEALVRWVHPERGPVSPAAFIPVAEETGIILPLGRWVLAEACRQAVQWRRGRAAAPYLAVNISGRQLEDPQLVADVAAALATAELEPSGLLLEVTEGVVMRDTESNLTRLHDLKALGVRVAIDDFGTGYSSLAYLQRFPVDVLKIDKAFVDGVSAGGSDAALTRTIIALGETLGLTTVAEGIEDAAQQASLRALGCELGQGYLFARPLVAADLARLLDARAPAPGALPG